MECSLCSKKAIARGLCRAHYQERWKAGLPELTLDKRSAPLEERFLSKITIDDNGCWKWTSSQDGQGYGMIWKGTKNVPAHRESYKLFNGPIRDEDVICHKCDVRDCVNPDHLFVGDRGDNNRDMFAKRRHKFGSASHLAKLNEASVQEILDSTETNTSLAKRYGVNQSTISRIRTGLRWKTALS